MSGQSSGCVVDQKSIFDDRRYDSNSAHRRLAGSRQHRPCAAFKLLEPAHWKRFSCVLFVKMNAESRSDKEGLLRYLKGSDGIQGMPFECTLKMSEGGFRRLR